MKHAPLLICRADADERIGTGHVMRCIALADGWRKAGGEAILIGNIPEKLSQRASASFSSIAALDGKRGINATIEKIKKYCDSDTDRAVWIVLDGYQFDTDWQMKLSELGFPLMVVDDFAHLDSYHCDIILNQNVGAEQFKYRTKEYTKLLLGSGYILLREELLKERRSGGIPRDAQNILVTMGGIDASNMTLRVLESLIAINDDSHIRVLLGSENPNIDSVRSFAKSTPYTKVIVQSNQMSEHYQWATLAISAAGTTSWELCYYGIPSLLIQIADNQTALAEHLEKTGSVRNLGWHEHVDKEMIANSLNNLIADCELRSAMSRNAQALVDGKGAQRVVDEMMNITSSLLESKLYADSQA